jgi:hypothetical protein
MVAGKIELPTKDRLFFRLLSILFRLGVTPDTGNYWYYSTRFINIGIKDQPGQMYQLVQEDEMSKRTKSKSTFTEEQAVDLRRLMEEVNHLNDLEDRRKEVEEQQRKEVKEEPYNLDSASRDLEIEAGLASLIMERDEIAAKASGEFKRGWAAAMDFLVKKNKLILETFNKFAPGK